MRFKSRWFLFVLSTALLAVALVHAQTKRPYVLLVSLDGFRYDYIALHGAPNLEQFAREGVRAAALIPSYPSTTFPNHLSIATGLYPEHHGIVENEFFDPSRRATFHYNQTDMATDGSWYGGTPLWVLAQQQGVRTATFFWPGSDAEIQKTRPWAYRVFDQSTPNETRIHQVIDWFSMPEAERPHLVTLYLGDVDRAGHDVGPDGDATRQAVKDIDRLLGDLFEGLRAHDAAVDVFIVSDHGMLRRRDMVPIGTELEFAGFTIPSTTGHDVQLYTSDVNLARRTVTTLNARDPRFHAYLRSQIPARLHYRDSPRIGDVVVMPTGPDILYIERAGSPAPSVKPGQHGYDPEQFREMRGIFFAKGPDLKSGLAIPAFENVHIYPLIARLLRLTPPSRLDGKLDVLRPILK